MTLVPLTFLFHASPPLGLFPCTASPSAALVLLPSLGVVRGCSLTRAPGVSPAFNSDPSSFFCPFREYTRCSLSPDLKSYYFCLLSLLTEVQECCRKWQKLSSAAKGKNLIFKCFLFQLLLWQTVYQNVVLGLAQYIAAFLQLVELTSLWLLLLGSINSHVPNKKSLACHTGHKALQPFKR